MNRVLFALATVLLVSGLRAPASVRTDVEVDFESVPVGAFTRLETEVGTFHAVEGPAVIETGHPRTGQACLQLAGPRSVVELEFADGLDTAGELRFHAERWTARSPWSFTIDVRRDGTWTSEADLTDSVVVGRPYRSSVRLPLGEGVEAVRLAVESPPGTGLLVDDLVLVTPRPQVLVAADVVPPDRDGVPVLKGRDSSPVSSIRLDVDGMLDPLRILGLEIDLDGTTDVADIETVLVRLGRAWDAPDARQVLEVAPEDCGNGVLRLPDGTGTLEEGTSRLMVGCRLSSEANLDHRIAIRVRRLEFDRSDARVFDDPPAPRRLGVALRQGGDEGVHTYRIPGLARTNAGTLLAVYDIRRSSGRDLPGDIDVGLSRSTDGGRSWSPMQVIMDMGDDPAWRHDGIGDPSILVDRETGTIWVAALWSHGDRGWHGSGPGLAPEETGQFMLVRSDDDGVTWSSPIDITSQVKDPGWSLMLQGPGKGITLADGTLVFPAQYRSSPETDRVPHSTVVWSKDHGRTWHAGTGAFPHTTESQVVEIEPGRLMLNCRYDLESVRVVMLSDDLGRSWRPHSTSRRALVEPRACMASLIDVDQELGRPSRGRLLFSNPDDAEVRRRITIRGSTDGGRTWPREGRLLLDTGRGAGYSCLAMIDEETIGILYEGSQAHLVFQRVPLSALDLP